MNIKIGITQGGLSLNKRNNQTLPQNTPQTNPIQSWKQEFDNLNKLENITLFNNSSYKINKLSHIEWVITKQNFKDNPLFDKKNVLKPYPIIFVSANNMLDKNFYKKEFMDKNLKPICDAALKNGIKYVEIPLKNITNIENLEPLQKLLLVKNLKEYAKKYKKSGLIFLLDFECAPELILSVIKGVSNLKLTYDVATITAYKGKNLNHKHFLSKLYKNIVNVRLKDVTMKGVSAEIGEGDVDFNEIFSNLVFTNKYKGYFTLQAIKSESGKEIITVANCLKYFMRAIASIEKVHARRQGVVTLVSE